jgi:8-oxo-dGTP diphosphatase
MVKINVVGAAVVSNGKVLCCRRGKGNFETIGKWEFPGGKVEQGETEREALRREIREELHYDIEVNAKIVTSQHDYEFGTVVMTTYYCEPISVNQEPVLTEHTELKWLKPSKLDILDWAPVDMEAVEFIQSGGYYV